MKYTEVCKYNMEMMKKSKHHKLAVTMSVISILFYLVYAIHTYITQTKIWDIVFPDKDEEDKKNDNEIRLDLVYNSKEDK